MDFNACKEYKENAEEVTLRILSIMEDTTVDGPGFRTTIYAAGCKHHCEGCHNPQSWAMNGGRRLSVAEIMDVIVSDPFANVTFSGGDPMFQVEGFTALAKAIRRHTNKSIWCYTGFTFETLLQDPLRRQLLEEVDVLVDAPFILSLRDETLRFRGSSNQRIIDVQASLRGEIVLWEEE